MFFFIEIPDLNVIILLFLKNKMRIVYNNNCIQFWGIMEPPINNPLIGRHSMDTGRPGDTFDVSTKGAGLEVKSQVNINGKNYSIVSVYTSVVDIAIIKSDMLKTLAKTQVLVDNLGLGGKYVSAKFTGDDTLTMTKATGAKKTYKKEEIAGQISQMDPNANRKLEKLRIIHNFFNAVIPQPSSLARPAPQTQPSPVFAAVHVAEETAQEIQEEEEPRLEDNRGKRTQAAQEVERIESGGQPSKMARNYKVVTFNVQTDVRLQKGQKDLREKNAAQKADFLTKKGPALDKLIKDEKPAVLLLQEVPHAGAKSLLEKYSSDYHVIFARKRYFDKNKNKFVNRNDFCVTLIKKKHFNYEGTPGIVEPNYFKDGEHFALLTKVKDKLTGQPVTIFNTHLKGGKETSVGNEESKELSKWLENDNFVIGGGDFNAESKNDKVKNLTNNNMMPEGATGQTDLNSPKKGRKVDHVFSKGGASFFRPRVIDMHGASDHNAVVATANFSLPVPKVESLQIPYEENTEKYELTRQFLSLMQDEYSKQKINLTLDIQEMLLKTLTQVLDDTAFRQGGALTLARDLLQTRAQDKIPASIDYDAILEKVFSPKT